MTREPHSRLATALMFGWPLILVGLVALWVLGVRAVGDLARPRTPDPGFGAPAEHPPDDRPLDYHLPDLRSRADLLGMTLADLKRSDTSDRVLVFGRRLHAVALHDPRVATDAVVRYAARIRASDGGTLALLLRVDEPQPTSVTSQPLPWWYPDHRREVHQRGAAACFECHDARQCSYCHVEKAHGYLGVTRTVE